MTATNVQAIVNPTAPVAQEDKQPKNGFVGKRLSMKQMKLYLARTPKHNGMQREMTKHFLGLRKSAPQQLHNVGGVATKKAK